MWLVARGDSPAESGTVLPTGKRYSPLSPRFRGPLSSLSGTAKTSDLYLSFRLIRARSKQRHFNAKTAIPHLRVLFLALKKVFLFSFEFVRSNKLNKFGEFRVGKLVFFVTVFSSGVFWLLDTQRIVTCVITQ